MNAPPWIAIPVTLLLGSAAWADVRSGRVPNVLTFSALVIGLGTHFAIDGRSGLVGSIEGALLAGGLLFPGWLMGWMGGGDVKLAAAIGAWLGLPQALFAVLASLMAGGLIAVLVAARSGVLKRSLFGAAQLGAWLMSGVGRTEQPSTSGVRFPFAVAILAGTSVMLWVIR